MTRRATRSLTWCVVVHAVWSWGIVTAGDGSFVVTGPGDVPVVGYVALVGALVAQRLLLVRDGRSAAAVTGPRR
ncbi:hypothetical protein GCM10025865_10250 [Paraoerskovia sediminicola]|uniref:Uncharacterized protein n=1 Tax=Paraoerskovia sediminicola TaxID=1138587 RepID=A0ABN6XA46_9CELL|nr:hypothetical protein [Paraoerskovia sediminicola]BDZ41726.1 hypothetical protein GCM10025865_10250 [Paraoerskovia sediminicola]